MPIFFVAFYHRLRVSTFILAWSCAGHARTFRNGSALFTVNAVPCLCLALLFFGKTKASGSSRNGHLRDSCRSDDRIREAILYERTGQQSRMLRISGP